VIVAVFAAREHQGETHMRHLARVMS